MVDRKFLLADWRGAICPTPSILSKSPKADIARGSAPSGLCVFQAEAVAPALDMAGRGRREVHRAAQRVGVAVALEEIPARPDSLVAVGVDAHDQVGIAGLD